MKKKKGLRSWVRANLAGGVVKATPGGKMFSRRARQIQEALKYKKS